MALKATVEPMLIKESSAVKRNVSKTELRGIFQPGFTCSRKDKLAKPKQLKRCAQETLEGKEDTYV